MNVDVFAAEQELTLITRDEVFGCDFVPLRMTRRHFREVWPASFARLDSRGRLSPREFGRVNDYYGACRTRWLRSGGLWGGGWIRCCLRGRGWWNLAARVPAPHSAVLPEVQAQAARGDAVVEIPLELIDENPYQTRYFAKDQPASEDFVATTLDELADSIRANGVIQPISVRPGAEGHYVLILGERRCRASKIAGKTTIPAIVRKVSDQQAAEMTVVENLQRQDLNCMEQAAAFSQVEPGFQTDARADWAAGGDFAGVGFELHAVAAAAGVGDAVSAGGAAGIQRGAGAVDVA